MMRYRFLRENQLNSAIRPFFGLFCLLLFLGSAGAQRRTASQDWTLPQILDQLNHEARSFRTLSAQVERTKVTVVVNDRSTEAGKIYVRRDGKMRLNLTRPDPRTILRSGDKIYVYNPLIKQVMEYNLAKHREVVDQLLLLGFGTPAKAIEKAYRIRLGGERTLDGRKTVLLELTPKSKAMRNQIAQIRLWLGESNWLPVKQKFLESGTQDYFVIRYSDIVRNGRLSPSLFKPHWPKGTKKIRPEG